MNRSNIGNVVTNGMQVLSVGTTTAKRFLGRADSALNNLTKEERAQYNQYRADKMRDEMNDYYSGSDKPPKTDGDVSIDDESIDDVLGGLAPLEDNSEQVKQIQTKENNDISWIKSYRDNKTGRFISMKTNMEEE